MIVFLFVRNLCWLLGLYNSIKALRTGRSRVVKNWVIYWVSMFFFDVARQIADVAIGWFPFYGNARLLVMIWILLAQTKATKLLFAQFVKPLFSRREKYIDEILDILAAIFDIYHLVRVVNILKGFILCMANRLRELARRRKEDPSFTSPFGNRAHRNISVPENPDRFTNGRKSTQPTRDYLNTRQSFAGKTQAKPTMINGYSPHFSLVKNSRQEGSFEHVDAPTPTTMRVPGAFYPRLELVNSHSYTPASTKNKELGLMEGIGVTTQSKEEIRLKEDGTRSRVKNLARRFDDAASEKWQIPKELFSTSAPNNFTKDIGSAQRHRWESQTSTLNTEYPAGLSTQTAKKKDANETILESMDIDMAHSIRTRRNNEKTVVKPSLNQSLQMSKRETSVKGVIDLKETINPAIVVGSSRSRARKAVSSSGKSVSVNHFDAERKNMSTTGALVEERNDINSKDSSETNMSDLEKTADPGPSLRTRNRVISHKTQSSSVLSSSDSSLNGEAESKSTRSSRSSKWTSIKADTRKHLVINSTKSNARLSAKNEVTSKVIAKRATLQKEVGGSGITGVSSRNREQESADKNESADVAIKKRKQKDIPLPTRRSVLITQRRRSTRLRAAAASNMSGDKKDNGDRITSPKRSRPTDGFRERSREPKKSRIRERSMGIKDNS
ncbi:uncharacterized protein VTP21DRAFT_10001 [Calcarisporiella thermophila]|uniref:uncharacterized protein n=1 Tax=Calcarisporiella thermophila TaxID=911321 RepID=UPI0037441BF7